MQVKSLANQKTSHLILKFLISLIFTGDKSKRELQILLETESTLFLISSTNFIFGVCSENTVILHKLLNNPIF